MTDNRTPEDLAWLAARDQLIAQVGAARLDEAKRRGWASVDHGATVEIRAMHGDE